MSVREWAIVAAIVSSLLPVAAVLIRGQSRLSTLATILAALSTSAFFVILLEIVEVGSDAEGARWVTALLASGVPLLLSGYLLSTILGRELPYEAFRRNRRIFALLGVIGVAFLAGIRHPLFLSGYDWAAGHGEILLAPLGKAYLSFLLIGIVLTGYNLESTYRTAGAPARLRLRIPFLGFFAILGFLTYVLTTGLLYSEISLNKLLAAGGPFVLGNSLVAYGFVRGSLIDAAAPVSRNIVYSSFTALAAGLYVFAVGIVAQLSSFTKWSPDEVVSLSLAFLAVLIAVLFLVSNRFQRRVRRFIDRNFYVNRYDYRSQWSRVTRAMEQAQSQTEVLNEASTLLRDIFLADRITIARLDPATGSIRPVLGDGTGQPDVVLREGEPLPGVLARTRRSMLLDRRPDDFEYIAIYAEHQEWLDATASQIIGPLFDGEELVGVVGLARKFEDDPFTFEDVALLDSVSGHVASAIRSARLSEELADSREMELLSQWSSMLLHDLKNYLAPLRMVAQNIVTHRDKPEMPEIVSRDLNRVADRMETLVRTLSDLRQAPQASATVIDPNRLVRDTMENLQLERQAALTLRTDLRATQGTTGDAALLRRVVENLVSNAIEAMHGRGTLTLASRDEDPGTPGATVVLTVTDTGAGMSEDFIRERLFRPFATTKDRGLGLGLHQSRSIVRAHGGAIRVQSTPGSGTSFQVVLRAAPLPAPDPQDVALAGASGGSS